MILPLRHQVMTATDENTIYLARNLVCDGATFYDTGFAPFYGDNKNTDFKITLRLSSFTKNATQDVVLGCKYEGTLSGQSYPGLYVRLNNSNTNTFHIGGYNYYTPTIASLLNKNIQIWRKSGTWKALIDGLTEQTLSIRVAEFNQNIVIGAGVQTNGNKFRYSICNIDYIRIEYI